MLTNRGEATAEARGGPLARQPAGPGPATVSPARVGDGDGAGCPAARRGGPGFGWVLAGPTNSSTCCGAHGTASYTNQLPGTERRFRA